MDKLERRVISNNIVPVELIPATATTDVHTDKIVKAVYIPLANQYYQTVTFIYKRSDGSILNLYNYRSSYNVYWDYGTSNLRQAWHTSSSSNSTMWIISGDVQNNTNCCFGSTTVNNRYEICPGGKDSGIFNADRANAVSEYEITNDGSYYVKFNFERLYSNITSVYIVNGANSVHSVYYGPYIQKYLFWATDGTLTLTPYYEYLEEE